MFTPRPRLDAAQGRCSRASASSGVACCQRGALVISAIAVLVDVAGTKPKTLVFRAVCLHKHIHNIAFAGRTSIAP